MTSFIGYSTVNKNKKFTLLDKNLVIQDLVNSFSVRQGQLPGVPWFGTTIWDDIFENQTLELEQAVLKEVKRICTLDPRLALLSVEFYPFEHGFMILAELQLVSSDVPTMVNLFFDQSNKSVNYTFGQ